jgi:hypothetical protein
VKTASFQSAEWKAGSATATPTGPEPAADDATDKLRRLAQLRDSGAISEAEFQVKKNDLLSRT